MRTPTPQELIRQAKGHTASVDRWAALRQNPRETFVPPLPEPEHTHTLAREMPLPPPIPPFAPPQPRNSALDEILKKHEQATRTASAYVPWEPKPPARE